MEKYAVFTESELVPTHELSLSNKIVEREDVSVIYKIVTDWLHTINPDLVVSHTHTVPTISHMIVTNKNYMLLVKYKEYNIRFQLNNIVTSYKVRKVK